MAGSLPGVIINTTSAPYYPLSANFSGTVGLGSHFIQALEQSQAAGTSTWIGDNGDPTVYQMGLALQMRM